MAFRSKTYSVSDDRSPLKAACFVPNSRSKASSSYGRGPKGEIWKIEDAIHPLVKLCVQLLSDDPLFFLINSYTTGLAPSVLSYMMGVEIVPKFGGTVKAEEVGLPVSQNGLVLPCGASGRWEK